MEKMIIEILYGQIYTAILFYTACKHMHGHGRDLYEYAESFNFFLQKSLLDRNRKSFENK